MNTPLSELEALVRRLAQQAHAEGVAAERKRVVEWLLVQSTTSVARETEADQKHDERAADRHSAQSSAYSLAACAIGEGKHEVKQ